MSEESYTPEVTPSPDTTDNLESLIAPLMATKSWVRFISILGFIGCAFIVIGAVVMMKLTGNIGHGQFGQAASGFTSVISIFYLIAGILYFVPSYYLFKYASAIAAATLSRTVDDISIALNYQKSFWKFAGILILVTFVLGLLGGILVPVMMATGMH